MRRIVNGAESHMLVASRKEKFHSISIVTAVSLLVTLVGVMGCERVEPQVDVLARKTYDQRSIADAKCIEYVVRCQSAHKFGPCWSWVTPVDSMRIWCDTILYSPLRTKLFAIIVVRNPVPESELTDERRSRPYSYAARAVVGFRTSVAAKWQIYPFEQYAAYYSDPTRAIRGARRYYFNELAADGEYIANSAGTELVPAKFRYNVDDPKFWDSSLVWRKGARIPGYYNFQTASKALPGDSGAVLSPPPCSCP